VLDEPAGSASLVVLTRGEGEDRQSEVVVQTTLRLVGLDPRDGAVRWEHPLVFQPSGVSPTALAVGDRLICSTQDTGTLSLKLPTDRAATPELGWWKQDVASYFSSGAVGVGSGKQVVIVTNALVPLPRADLRCLDPADGTEHWQKQGLGRSSTPSSPAAACSSATTRRSSASDCRRRRTPAPRNHPPENER
jgi:outer membrane protein assembly factor BamB